MLHLPAARELGLDAPEAWLLVDIHTCNDDIDGPMGFRLYQDMKTIQCHDMSVLKCLVGRAEIERQGRTTWAIIDRSGNLGDAFFAAEEVG